MTDLTNNKLRLGRLKVELLENDHLWVETRKFLGKQETLIVDVACLAPKISIAAPRGSLALRLAQLVTLLAGGSALYAIWRSGGSVQTGSHTFAFTILLLAALIGVILNHHAMKRICLKTRYVQLLLLTIPVPRRRRRDVEAFLSLVRERMREVETKRGLTREQLRSGELRTLRRLASERLIPVQTYEEAKLSLLN